MSSSANNGGAQAPAAGEATPVPINPQVIEAYESMLAAVPDAGESGVERILEVIASAQDVTELDAAWRTEDTAGLAGIPQTIRAVTKMPSDFQGGLPWFLVVEAINEVTGEPITWTTGSISVVAQLVKAWSMGAFPLRARLEVAERPSRSGFYPQHLVILSQPKANAAAAGASGAEAEAGAPA